MGMNGPAGGNLGTISEERGGEEGVEADGRVYGGHGLVKVVRAAREHHKGRR